MKFNIFDYAPGVIAVTCGSLGRYTEFNLAMQSLVRPNGTVERWERGLSIAAMCNLLVRDMLANASYEWIWFMDDDHIFPPDILLRLLDEAKREDVDMVVPLTVRRGQPFKPVIYGGEEQMWVPLGFAPLRNWRNGDGLVQIRCNGKAGMLIKRHVLEGTDDPWFEFGKTNPQYSGMDLYFCEKAARAGFKLWIAPHIHFGHLLHNAAWPIQLPDGKWSTEIRQPQFFSEHPDEEPVMNSMQQELPPSPKDREQTWRDTYDAERYRAHLSQCVAGSEHTPTGGTANLDTEPAVV